MARIVKSLGTGVISMPLFSVFVLKLPFWSVILGDASVDRPIEAALGLAERQAGENAWMRTGFQVAEKLFELPGALVELADGLFVGFLVGLIWATSVRFFFPRPRLDLLGRRLLHRGGDLGLLFPQLPVGLAQGGQPGRGKSAMTRSWAPATAFERPDLVDGGSQIARFQGIAGDAETAVLVDG